HEQLIESYSLRVMRERERAKWLETVLHAVPSEEMYRDSQYLLKHCSRLGDPASVVFELLRTLFNEVSLSPYTDLVDNALYFVSRLDWDWNLGRASIIDWVAWLLRQNGRHLTAYDLITFHHRGANFPDALLLDATMKTYLSWIQRNLELFVDT